MRADAGKYSDQCIKNARDHRIPGIALCLEGEKTIPERKIILEAKQKALEVERKRIEEAIAYIDWKQGFYDNVLSGKTKYFCNLLPRE